MYEETMHGVTFGHKGDVPRGLAHLKELPPEKVSRMLEDSRKAMAHGAEITLHADGENRNYVLKHTGYDRYELLARSNH